MTPEVARAVADLQLARIAEGTNLNRHAPEVAKAIDKLLAATKAGTR